MFISQVYNIYTIKGTATRKPQKGKRKMYTFKVTFRNDETGKTKTYTVKAAGMFPAIEGAQMKALNKMMLFCWTLTKAELIG